MSRRAEPAAAGQQSAEPAAVRAPRGARLRGKLGWAAVLTVGLVFGVVSLLVHHTSWVGLGDHYYYSSMALQYAGVPYDQAIREATSYFHYPLTAVHLDLGYQNPLYAALIYPRVVYPLLAVPAVKVMGVSGIWVSGALLGTVTVVVLVLLALRRVGPAGAAVLPFLLMGSFLVGEFTFGLFSETSLIALGSVMLVVLPLGRARGWSHALTAAALVPLMMMSRQVPLLPVGIVAGGWLWSAVASRRARNEWAPFVVTVGAATLATYAVMAVWAPYDPLLALRVFTHTKTLGAMVRAIPGLFITSVRQDAAWTLGHDPVGVLLAVLTVTGLVLVIRRPLAGVFLGSLFSGLVTIALNGQVNYFRYISPTLPVAAMLAAVTASWLWLRIRRRPWSVPAIAGGPTGPGPATDTPGPVTPLGVADSAGQDAIDPAGDQGSRTGRARTWAAPVAAWLVVALLAGLTVALHQPSAARPGASVAVSRAEYGSRWPFTVASGTLSCAGDDYQVWFDGADGRRYALSGTAMARSFLAPRVTSIRAGTATFDWPQIVPLLDRGMRLCGGRGYGYHRGP